MAKTATDVLGALLVKSGILTQDQLADAVQAQKGARDSLDKILIDRKHVTRPTLISLLSDHYQVPFRLLPEKIDVELIKLLPEHVLTAYRVVPLAFDDGVLTLGTLVPGDTRMVDRISAITGYRIRPVGMLECDLESFFGHYFEDSTMAGILKEIGAQQRELTLTDDAAAGEDEKPVVKLVNSILGMAAKKRASDVHIEPQRAFALLRFRVDGILQTQQIIPDSALAAVIARIKVMAQLDITERRVPQDGQFRHRLSDRDVDVRVSIMPSRYGEKVAMRVLDRRNFLMSLDLLGMPADMQESIERLLARATGLFLVTGPTGSGKTTSLYALIQRLRSPRLNIMTLENPIEYELLAGSNREGGITQIQVNTKMGLDFASGLRACLRQDPDVLFVGEIRDKETAETAISASLTGHLVLSSLHTNGAIQTIVRLIDMGVEPFLIVSALRAVVAQRLVRALCHHCKEPYTPPAEVLKRLDFPIEEGKAFYRPKGCEACQQQGYWGRTGVFEMVTLSGDLNGLILERRPANEIYAKARAQGLKTLKQHGIELVNQGLTTVEEVLRVLPAL